MILRLSDLTKSLKDLKKFYLFYGSNTGQIEETINKVLKPKLTNNIYNYEESEIITNIDEFEENILNKSFFDDEKLIIINRVSDKILGIIENLILKNITETTIVIKTGIF